MESVLLLLSDLHTTSTETLKGLLGGGRGHQSKMGVSTPAAQRGWEH